MDDDMGWLSPLIIGDSNWVSGILMDLA